MIKALEGNKILTIRSKDLTKVISLLKYHTRFRNTQLLSIRGGDFLNNEKRFTVVYMFRCYNRWLSSTGEKKEWLLKVKVDEREPLESMNNVYPNRLWYEREIWDMFGIYFLNNPNMRRLLNDYGFEGFPLRKDFPLTGYNQVQYDISKKRIVSTDIELGQK